VANGLIRENIALTRSGEQVHVIKRNVLHLGGCRGAPFDLVFLDPPYAKGLGPRAIEVLQVGGWLAPDALLVCEENAPLEVPAGFDLEDRRKYGDTHVTLLRART
jgi:16S rRNA (guanine966-N2)-methyltransferase